MSDADAQKVIERWLRRKYSRKSKNWAGTCERAAEEWIEFCDDDGIDWMNQELNQYHLEDYAAWLNEKHDYSDNTRHNKLMAVRNMLSYAAGRYDANVLLNKEHANSVYEASVSKSSATHFEEETGDRIPYVEMNDYEAMLETVENPRDDLLLRILYDTGARPKELVNATIDDVNFDKRKITVETAKLKKEEKKGQTRDVYLQPTTKRILGEWLYRGGRQAYSSCATDSDYILLTQRSPKMQVSSVNRQVKRIAQRAGVQEEAYTKEMTNVMPWKDGDEAEVDVTRSYKKITTKQFRSAFCVRAVRNGISLGMLQELTGHQSAESLEPYLQFREEDKREAFDHYL